MIRLRRPGLMVICGLLAMLLLLAEYWLLLNSARQRDTERLSQWGIYSLSTLNQRLQSALDFSALLATNYSNKPVELNSTFLAKISSEAVRPGTPFNGVALVEEVATAGRAAFETHLNHPIQLIHNHRRIISPEKLRYYPIIGFLPNDANSLPQGLDLGSIPDMAKRREQYLTALSTRLHWGA